MRRMLDAIYLAAGVAGALAILAIFLLVGFQVAARIADWSMRLLGLQPFGTAIPSIAEICGFLLAAGSFLALPYTLMRGGHIRIGLVSDRLPAAARRYVETIVGLAATVLSGYAAIAMGRLAFKSFSFGDVSYGILPIPLALPQSLMCVGLVIMTIALIDVTVARFLSGRPLPAGEGL